MRTSFLTSHQLLDIDQHFDNRVQQIAGAAMLIALHRELGLQIRIRLSRARRRRRLTVERLRPLAWAIRYPVQPSVRKPWDPLNLLSGRGLPQVPRTRAAVRQACAPCSRYRVVANAANQFSIRCTSY